MVALRARETCIVRGFAQYNKGDRAVFSEEEALSLLEQYPESWVEEVQEDSRMKAPSKPPTNKMVKAPERKK